MSSASVPPPPSGLSLRSLAEPCIIRLCVSFNVIGSVRTFVHKSYTVELTFVVEDSRLTSLSFISDVARKRRLLALFLFTWAESSEEDPDSLENLESDMMLVSVLGT